ncbi:MAG: hypothetical protein RI924_950 [Bacteroidota bacterium]
MYLVLSLMLTCIGLQAQEIQSPEQFLGYALGEHYTPHYRVLEYFRYVSSVSKNVKLQEYGKSTEGRPLIVAFIASTDHMNRLEEIRNNNLRMAGIQAGTPSQKQPAIAWLSYNVHGNEPTSTEASMQTLYELVNPANTRSQSWLQNTVVVMDPCINPDGRERYVNFYNPIHNQTPDPLRFTREHAEPWPGGRTNHYYFDLNRDWAWQTQKETQHRIALYNQWLPQVHVDFHEQGIDAPYYFAPAAEPVHQDITSWQRDFQVIVGKNNARYFDEKGWMYFTRERFDLLYPSYGDTYPTYNGSIGMTYEQGGIGGGLAVINAEEDTLTLKARVAHHFTTGIATVESVSANADRLLGEFQKFFDRSKTNPSGVYKSYIIKGDNQKKLQNLADLLDRNGIAYGYGAAKAATGFNYFTGKTEKFNIQRNDMVINAFQPKSVLLKVLFEPVTFVSDSNTYDITAWSLPYAHGIQSYASAEAIKPAFSTTAMAAEKTSAARPVAYVAEWNALADVKFLTALLNKKIKVRYSESEFESAGKKFLPGSLIIARTSNGSLGSRFDELIGQVAKDAGVNLYPVSTGFADKGPDLGSSSIRYIKNPKVLLLSGEYTSSQQVGQIWHFFEKQINYPISVVRYADFYKFSWKDFNVIILPDGDYPNLDLDQLQSWVRAGGKLIVMETALNKLAGSKQFDLKDKEEQKEDQDKNSYSKLKIYGNRERDALTENIPGAIYRVDMDQTHPLGYGYPGFYYTLKLDDKVYNYLDKGWNVGVFKKNNYLTGFAGVKSRQKLMDGLVFGVQDLGRGSVVYMADNPLFRGFWENGKLLFSNAVFMVGQ